MKSCDVGDSAKRVRPAESLFCIILFIV